jgi:hypothetical protein
VAASPRPKRRKLRSETSATKYTLTKVLLDAAVMGTCAAGVGMFAKTIGAIPAYRSCPWRRRIGPCIAAGTWHPMSVAVDVISAIARLLLCEDDAAKKQDGNKYDCGSGRERTQFHASMIKRRPLRISGPYSSER